MFAIYLGKLRDIVWAAKAGLRVRRMIARRPRERGFVQSIYGPYLRDRPGDRTFELCVTGYGSLISNVIEQRSSPFIFVDIGANCGVFSLLAARHPLCTSVIAIEPVPATFEALSANIDFNTANNVRAVRALVSQRSGEILRLSYNPRHSGMSKIARGTDENTVAAPVLDASGLSDLVGKPDRPALVKIDVEGSEADALDALKSTSFFPAVTDIVVEISERTGGIEHVRDLKKILQEFGFEEVGREGADEHYDAHYSRLDRFRAAPENSENQK